MVELFAATIISCSDAIRITNRLANVIGLTYQQKIELIQVISNSIPTCPSPKSMSHFNSSYK